MSQRAVVRGRTWLEPLTPTSCRANYRVEIEVKIVALSSMLEQGLEKRVRDSYAKLAAMTARYTQTDACRALQGPQHPAQQRRVRGVFEGDAGSPVQGGRGRRVAPTRHNPVPRIALTLRHLVLKATRAAWRGGGRR